MRSGLASTIITCLVLILANPIHIQSIQNPLKNGVDILFVLDLSKKHVGRRYCAKSYVVGKRVLTNFISERTDDRIGLVGFAGKPFVFSPLTFDRKSLTLHCRKYYGRLYKTRNSWIFRYGYLRCSLTSYEDTIVSDIPERKKILILLTDRQMSV